MAVSPLVIKTSLGWAHKEKYKRERNENVIKNKKKNDNEPLYKVDKFDKFRKSDNWHP